MPAVSPMQYRVELGDPRSQPRGSFAFPRGVSGGHQARRSRRAVGRRGHLIMRFFLVLLCCLTVDTLGCQSKLPIPAQPSAANHTVTELVLESPGGPCRGKLVAPIPGAPGPAERPGLLLIHEDHGLTDWELAQARKLVQEGYVVFAVDLYGGQKVDSAMDAHIMERGLPQDRVLSTLKTAVDYLARVPNVHADRLGVIGWDIGGGYALDAARNDSRLKACVICYGRVVTDPALLAPLQAAVLGIFAGNDEGISHETLAAFKKALLQAGKNGAVKVFVNSNHGFMNPASPEAGGVMDPQANQAAWEAILTFLAAELKKP
jgi:carboxymethylenebutenolidase